MADLSVLDVQLYGQSIGTITRLPGDRVLFAFDDAYVADGARPTLSLSYKDAFGGLITEIKPTQTRLPPFFSNLLPEGAMRDYLAARAKVNPAREFFLIWALGLDLPGALTIKSIDGETLPPARDDDASHERATDEDGALRFSLAGVQLKFSAVKQAAGGLTIPVDGIGGSWIVKLPSTTHRGLPENEFAMMELARRIGIDVPETALVHLAEIRGLPAGIDAVGSQAFAIKRFDRTAMDGPIHIEDFAQIFRIYPQDKYGKVSYRNIAQVLWIETGEIGTAEFIRRLVFNALIGNGDMHAKNWSLTYPDRVHPQLAPAYDFVSTIAYIPGDKLALTFVDSKAFQSLTLDQFVRFGAKSGLPETLTLDTVKDTVSRFRDAWPHSKDLPITSDLRGTIERHIGRLPLAKL
ncbi:MAG TPA: HipA domain-containing protein [Rhizomicrobium sp.]|jgi:serine/threonine-protein kinase HipA